MIMENVIIMNNNDNNNVIMENSQFCREVIISKNLIIFM